MADPATQEYKNLAEYEKEQVEEDDVSKDLLIDQVEEDDVSKDLLIDQVEEKDVSKGLLIDQAKRRMHLRTYLLT